MYITFLLRHLLLVTHPASGHEGEHVIIQLRLHNISRNFQTCQTRLHTLVSGHKLNYVILNMLTAISSAAWRSSSQRLRSANKRKAKRKDRILIQSDQIILRPHAPSNSGYLQCNLSLFLPHSSCHQIPAPFLKSASHCLI